MVALNNTYDLIVNDIVTAKPCYYVKMEGERIKAVITV